MREYWAILSYRRGEVGPVTDSVSVKSDKFCEFFSAQSKKRGWSFAPSSQVADSLEQT
jgi:hypothetical protein